MKNEEETKGDTKCEMAVLLFTPEFCQRVHEFQKIKANVSEVTSNEVVLEKLQELREVAKRIISWQTSLDSSWRKTEKSDAAIVLN